MAMTGPGQLPGSVRSDGSAWADLAGSLDWLPVASLLLAADGTALAVSRAWSVLSGLMAEDSLTDGWAGAVEPLDRGMLRTRLRDAAAAGRSGYADAWLAVRRNGVADPASGAEPAGNLLRAAAEQVSAAIGPAGAAAQVAPGEFVALLGGLPGHDLAAVADTLVRRLFAAGLALQAAPALPGVPVAGRLQQVADELDGIIRDTQIAVFESRDS